jgi:2-methylisocitrate lyase-like PEP mutase family enzyme
MDHETPFLLALGMLIAASLVVSISGWVLFARDRALHRAAVHADAGADGVHHEAADEE